MRTQLLALLMIGAASGAAIADTVLHAGDTATVMVAPDEFAVSLQAQALLPTAAAAQARVNALMKDALETARGASAGSRGGANAITTSTGNYGVWRIDAADQPERWQATQTLNLSGKDDAAILALVGGLQQKGLAVSSLGWRLSQAAERDARQRATKQALTTLRSRIDDAAGVLGLRFEAYKDVRLDAATPQPIFARTMASPMAGGVAAPPPNTVPEDIAVTARAEADALLRPE